MDSQTHEIHRKAVGWLRHLTCELDANADIIDAMPVADVRAELRASEEEREQFHAMLRKTLRTAQAHDVKQALIKWFSVPWKPEWAGQFVGAADIPRQAHTFPIQGGQMTATCAWKPQAEETPAYLEIAWAADTVLDGEFWCRFINPDSREVLKDTLLGTYKEGGKYFTAQTLGFDPSNTPWEIVLLMKESRT